MGDILNLNYFKDFDLSELNETEEIILNNNNNNNDENNGNMIDSREPLDELEIFDMIRNLNDPEHPLTLEQLNVVGKSLIDVDDENGIIDIRFTPTIPHCSMATLIGLCIRVKLLRSLPSRFKLSININPGTHASEKAVNKQLNDKERVQAALENERL